MRAFLLVELIWQQRGNTFKYRVLLVLFVTVIRNNRIKTRYLIDLNAVIKKIKVFL